MNAFFSPKSRISVSKPVALLMNTLNLLGPALLLCAVILLGISHFGHFLPELNHVFMIAAALLIAGALIIRIAWGITVRILVARHRREEAGMTDDEEPPR